MILYILRGVPGCGKSTLAKTLAPPECICETDDFHMKNGVYEFKRENVGAAHLACRAKVRELMGAKAPRIVVSNTNVTSADVNIYLQIAEKNGYQSFVMVVENRHDGKDSHGVPEETLRSMGKSLNRSGSIKLR